MGKKLYVGNLNYQVTNASLETLFAEHGTVRSAQVVTDRDTGGSKGFGFVEMADEQAAKAAIDALHDREVDGRRLVVNEARPREERPGNRGGYGGRR
ncbi:MAG: RNA recognition motif domain-containing protein [Planctomycetota bacterium]|jgi:RNA recognition motif-containing protein|nr:RNA-binding protein [Planctomycetota bacterium]MBM4057119.1 RNA-binding protein [Planctomycetota bacterium]